MRQRIGVRTSRGFTLIELVSVIIILGIVLVGVGNFITFGTQIFVDSSRVDSALNESRYALQRMSRELRNAMPNSIRVMANTTFQCIEFLPIEVSTSYQFVAFTGDENATNLAEVFKDAASTSISSGQRMYISASSTADIYSPSSNKFSSILAVNDNSAGTLRVTYSPVRTFPERSPSHRAYFTGMPVSYCFHNSNLIRYADYGFMNNQPSVLNLSNGSIVARNIANDLSNTNDRPIHYQNSTLVRSAVVRLTPRFNVGGEEIEYQHQVQVINVP